MNEFSDRQGLGPIARERLFAAGQEVLERSLGSFYDRMQANLRESGVDLDALPPLQPPSEREPRRKADAQADADTVAAPAIAPDGQASAPAAGGFAALHPMTVFPPRSEHYAKLAEQTVSMLSQDPDVPRTTNVWLGALRQSMQQEMLREPAFLQQRCNPLRELINELEHLGRLIEDGGQTEGEKRVAQTVSTIVAKAASDPRTASDKFQTAPAQVKHPTQQLSQRHQLNVERIVSNSFGPYRLKQVRKAVSETLNARYTSQQDQTAGQTAGQGPLDRRREYDRRAGGGRLGAARDQRRHSKQIRLVWVSEDREDFPFVGQSGIRALETTHAELTQRLCAGAFKPLTRDQRSLTKRSVDHLLNRLQSQSQDRDTRDSVTGLMNRIGFQPLLEKALGAKATDEAPPPCCAGSRSSRHAWSAHPAASSPAITCWRASPICSCPCSTTWTRTRPIWVPTNSQSCCVAARSRRRISPPRASATP